MSSKTEYLPKFRAPYIAPWQTDAAIQQHEEQRKIEMDAVIAQLAKFKLSKAQVENQDYCSCNCKPLCENSVCYLITYFVTRPWAIFKRVFCCCFCKAPPKNIPIPQEAGDTLSQTTEQFERNTCGVCCIAPGVIIATPFIPATALAASLLTILSGLVITQTAGTNTYVFSGDIGVVSDGHGNLIVQGGIRVDAITTIKYAFFQLAQHLRQKWKQADSANKRAIYQECLQIGNKERWEAIVQAIVGIGITKTAVENAILYRFSATLIKVRNEGKMLFAEQEAHFIVIKDDEQKTS